MLQLVRRLSLSTAMVTAIVATLPQVSHATVLQTVRVSLQTPGGGDSDTDTVFVPNAGDITNNILASIGGTGAGNPGYAATASAGIFGDLGIDMSASSIPIGSSLRASVLIATDEIVNLFNSPQRVTTNFIIDGGRMLSPFNFNDTLSFSLMVGAHNIGQTSAPTSEIGFDIAADLALGFGSSVAPFPPYSGAPTGRSMT